MNSSETQDLQLDRIQKRALAVGVVFAVLSLAGAFFSREQFFRSYLVAYLFWVGIALGCLAIVMLHHLVGGSWGLVIQRLLEAGTRTLPLLGLLILPLLFGIKDLYTWARPEVVAADELLRHKEPYLNVTFFLVRVIVYFAIWGGLTYFLNRWSTEQDSTGAPALARRLQALSGPGLVLFGLTVTFASIDWVMSLEPHWFSTMYGVMFMVGQVLATLAFIILMLAVVYDRKPLAGIVSAGHFHDLGNLMLAFVMLWAYIAFSQFLIIWSANVAEEVPWYLRRIHGGWEWVALALIAFHFALPFFLLLMRTTKRRIENLRKLALLMIAMRLIDLFWVVTPAFHPESFSVHWLDIAAPVGIGGLWIAAFIWQLKGRPLLPLQDPLLAEISHHD